VVEDKEIRLDDYGAVTDLVACGARELLTVRRCRQISVESWFDCEKCHSCVVGGTAMDLLASEVARCSFGDVGHR